MEYINLTTNQIKSQGEIRKEHANMSFPRVWNAGVFKLLGISPVLASPKPKYNTGTQTAVRDGAVQDASGNWVQGWKVVSMDEEVVESTLANAKRTKVAAIDTNTAASILALVSEPMQRNYLAKYSELLEKKVDGVLTEAEDEQMISLKSLWSQIEDLRLEGNKQEGLVEAATTLAEVEGLRD